MKTFNKPVRLAAGMIRLYLFWPGIIAASMCFTAGAWAQGNPSVLDLADLSLEELANIEVTSVSRRAQNISGAPASIYVITSEDIRRSGATSLPEVLRLAPNLQVARLDSVQYAITARGFNNAVGNKLLVLIDGRTIYTPMFSGVFWEMQEVMLEDVDRVEVISGPGAALWGANAVNGVINVITKGSADTQGGLVVGDAGNDEYGAGFRWGGAYGDASFRVYGKFRDWNNNQLADGMDVRDNWQRGQIGFRADWAGERQDFTLQGDAYKGESEHRGFAGDIEVTPVTVSGANLLGRWSRELGEHSNLRVQAYWSRSERDEMIIFRPTSDIFDLEFQHGGTLGAHQLLWGGGYRHAKDQVDPGFFSVFIPESRSLDWQNLFIQDELAFSERVKATLGLKLEWNDFTGMEYLPTARLAWNPAGESLLWTAVSRAVRAPSRFDRDVFFPGEAPFIVAGGPDFVSEVAKVFELGYRDQPLDVLSYSLTFFYHDWDKLRSGTPLPLPVTLVNNIKGHAYGVEAWANWQLTASWRLSGGVSTLDKDLAFQTGTTDTVGIQNNTLHNDPDYQWLARSSHNLSDNLEFDLYLRGVDELTVQPVPAYTELDARLAWFPLRNLELSVTGRNLLHRDHAEFGAAATRAELGRSVLLGLKWSL